MKKNIAFEQWVADQLTNGMIVMEPYGYREEEPGKYLHVFKVSLYFDDVPESLDGVAYIPIPFSNYAMECSTEEDDNSALPEG